MELGEEIRRIDYEKNVKRREKRNRNMIIRFLTLLTFIFLAWYYANEKNIGFKNFDSYKESVLFKQMDEFYEQNEICIKDSLCVKSYNQTLDSIFDKEFIGNDILYLMDIEMKFGDYRMVDNKYLVRFYNISKLSNNYNTYLEIYSIVDKYTAENISSNKKYKLGGIFKFFYYDPSTFIKEDIKSYFSHKPEFKKIDDDLWFYPGNIFVDNLRINEIN